MELITRFESRFEIFATTTIRPITGVTTWVGTHDDRKMKMMANTGAQFETMMVSNKDTAIELKRALVFLRNQM